MQLEFTKIHGAGNDFVVIDDFARTLDLTPQQVAFLCDRHKGIGADGVILVRPSERDGCAAYMHYINADGTLAEMCGNGVRCFAKFLVDGGFVSAAQERFVADTMAGSRPIRFTVDQDNKLASATVDMGVPIFAPAAIPTTLAQTRNVMHPLKTPYGMAQTGEPAVLGQTLEGLMLKGYGLENLSSSYKVSCVSMGNPHLLIFLDDISPELASAFAADPQALDIAEVGAHFESLTSVFPEKINVEFAAVDASNEARIVMRVWERGVGETQACGTGACATLVAAAATGRTGRKATVSLPGGDLLIDWRSDDTVMMTGLAATVFTGTVVV